MKTPSVSLNSVALCSSSCETSAKTSPARNDATNPLPPSSSEAVKLSRASPSTSSDGDRPEVQLRRLASTPSHAPTPPTTAATAIAMTISWNESSSQCCPGDSSAATIATNTVTNGVAMPSLRPLSTLSDVRMRSGTRGLVITPRLRAASVGARIVETRNARPQVRPASSQWPSSAPAMIASGRPTESSRTGIEPLRRRVLTPRVEASVNSRIARVTSVTDWTVSPPRGGWSTSANPGPRRTPATRKRTGPPTDHRSSRRDVSAKQIATADSTDGNVPIGSSSGAARLERGSSQPRARRRTASPPRNGSYRARYGASQAARVKNGNVCHRMRRTEVGRRVADTAAGRGAGARPLRGPARPARGPAADEGPRHQPIVVVVAALVVVVLILPVVFIANIQQVGFVPGLGRSPAVVGGAAGRGGRRSRPSRSSSETLRIWQDRCRARRPRAAPDGTFVQEYVTSSR